MNTFYSNNMRVVVMISLSLFSIFFLSSNADAQNFDEYFTDSTLRVDLQFAGNAREQKIYLDNLRRKAIWAGRKNRLNEILLQGNGQIEMRDHKNGTVLFVHTFSSLFTEWLNTEEARHIDRSFQQCFYLPMPKKAVDVRVMLRNNYQKIVAETTFTVDPNDILIRPETNNDLKSYYIQKSGNVTDCIDLAIIGEGYTESEMQKFRNDAQRATDLIFAHAPFTQLQKRFNVVAVEAPSKETGTSIPKSHVWQNTALQSHYSTFYIDRYLTTSEDKHLYDLLAGVPFEHIIIIVNTSEYGGGGIFNQYTIAAADHKTFPQVLVHEFGHAYGGLADEYDYGDNPEPTYPDGVEPWEPNITTQVNFASKWQDLTLSKKQEYQSWNIGLYEGAGYREKGVWRPVDNCRMKINNIKDFCPVCTRAIIRITDFYTAK